MKIIDAMNSSEKKYVTAVALGNFDGMHIDNQYLLKNNIEKAKEENLKPSVLIFKNHTKTILKKDETFKIDILTSFEEKIQLLKELGIEIVYVMDFNEQIMKLSPELFVKNILLERLNAKLVTVGFDYRFGYKAQGDSNYLKEL